MYYGIMYFFYTRKGKKSNYISHFLQGKIEIKEKQTKVNQKKLTKN